MELSAMRTALVLTCLSVLAASAGTCGESVRFAQFNIWELSRNKLDEVDEEGRGANRQLLKAAEILQRVRPDVLLINEIDFDPERRNVALFQERYLAHGQGGQAPLSYEHSFFEPVNTGESTGLDLDNDGASDGPGDAYGFGRYPGQYGMALLSRFPLAGEARTLRMLLWRSVPGNLIPDGRDGRPEWYDEREVEELRLSSKSHWDVPIDVAGTIVHVLSAHPTPSVFDGPEDYNGRRNFDEIRLLADYIAGGARGSYVTDDAGRPGSLDPDALFVVMGDLNADPVLDEGPYGKPAVAQLLELERVQDPAPTSEGGARQAVATGPPGHGERWTTRFGRLDYVLPSSGLLISGTGVFWPPPDDPLARLVEDPEPSSDHHLVWLDVEIRAPKPSESSK
jgi:endonuclease/exonuclease/phosphatase family metal-dependent hydrolase